MQTSKILINNIITNYCKYEGTSDFIVVFLHGRGRSGLDWQTYFEGLENRSISFLAIDFPGFGTSGLPDTARGVEEYSEFILNFLQKVTSVKKIVIIGHSFGGRVAFWIAGKYPDLLYRLILIAPGGIEKSISYFKKSILKIGKKIFNLPGLRTIGNTLKKKIGGQDYNETNGIMRDILTKVVNQDISYLLPNINIPVEVFRGDQDNQIEKRQIDVMQTRIPKVNIHTYPNIGHDLHKNIVNDVLNIL